MNDYTRRQEQIDQAIKQHRESEWRLNFLRTIEPQPHKPATEEEIIKCYSHHHLQPAQTSN